MTESPPSAPPGPGPSSTEPPPPERRGLRFSLLELMLIAMLLGLGLAALTPWYEARRTRANVARVRADLRSVAVAIEAYRIDWMTYPPCGLAEGPARTMPNGVVVPSGVRTVHSHLPPGSGARRMFTFGLPTTFSVPHFLTTPLAYLREFPPDPFADTPGATFGYFIVPTEWDQNARVRRWTPGPNPVSRFGPGVRVWFGIHWIVWSPGPDRDENAPDGPTDIGPVVEQIIPSDGNLDPALLLPHVYDATNGLHSEGDIIRVRQ